MLFRSVIYITVGFIVDIIKTKPSTLLFHSTLIFSPSIIPLALSPHVDVMLLVMLLVAPSGWEPAWLSQADGILYVPDLECLHILGWRRAD